MAFATRTGAGAGCRARRQGDHGEHPAHAHSTTLYISEQGENEAEQLTATVRRGRRLASAGAAGARACLLPLASPHQVDRVCGELTIGGHELQAIELSLCHENEGGLKPGEPDADNWGPRCCMDAARVVQVPKLTVLATYVRGKPAVRSRDVIDPCPALLPRARQEC